MLLQYYTHHSPISANGDPLQSLQCSIIRNRIINIKNAELPVINA